MQEKICQTGRELVFEEATEMIKNLMLVEVNAKQIERVCHYYGEELEIELPYGKGKEKEEESESDYRGEERKEGTHYFMPDGSMILTREEKWKEVKLCRIFAGENDVEVNKGRKMITKTKYVSHLGCAEEFFNKLEYYARGIKKKIFLADGAKWIWNYVDTYYPESVQILDFYHTKEHLCEYAKERIKDKEEREEWISEQIRRLLEDRVEEVIANISEKPKKSSRQERESREKLVNYYESHIKRMRYKSYIEAGYLIGSGPIESAHRTVIQERLKLSGQRWTKRGAQQILNLRVANLSGHWERVRNLMRQAA